MHLEHLAVSGKLKCRAGPLPAGLSHLFPLDSRRLQMIGCALRSRRQAGSLTRWRSLLKTAGGADRCLTPAFIHKPKELVLWI